MDKTDPAYAGQAGYSPAFLAIYDAWVIGVVAPRFLKTPIPKTVARYTELVGPRHLDVGPGTGYFLDKAQLDPATKLTLLDPNPAVLAKCARRLARFNPEVVEADVLKPLPAMGPFDSIGLSHVLHCLPGPMDAKGVAIANLASVLAPEGVLFGATMLGRDAHHTKPARLLIAVGNKQGGFDNLSDTADGLRSILEASFDEVDVRVVGSMAEFEARKPRRG